MVPMALIWWIYHFWARFWPYFNFVDFRAYFGPFSHVNRVESKPYGAIGQIWSLKSRIFFDSKYTKTTGVKRPGHKKIFCILSDTLLTTLVKAEKSSNLVEGQLCVPHVRSLKISIQRGTLPEDILPDWAGSLVDPTTVQMSMLQFTYWMLSMFLVTHLLLL